MFTLKKGKAPSHFDFPTCPLDVNKTEQSPAAASDSRVLLKLYLSRSVRVQCSGLYISNSQSLETQVLCQNMSLACNKTHAHFPLSSWILLCPENLAAFIFNPWNTSSFSLKEKIIAQKKPLDLLDTKKKCSPFWKEDPDLNNIKAFMSSLRMGFEGIISILHSFWMNKLTPSTPKHKNKILFGWRSREMDRSIFTKPPPLHV